MMNSEKWEKRFRSRKFWLILFPGITSLIFIFTASFMYWIYSLSQFHINIFLSFFYNLIIGPIHGAIFFILNSFLNSSFTQENNMLDPFMGVIINNSNTSGLSTGFFIVVFSIILFCLYVYFVKKAPELERKKLFLISIIILLTLLYSTIMYLSYFFGGIKSPFF